MSKQSDLINLTDAITVDGSNNVGIGTTSPSLPLEVYHATNSRILASTGGTGASQFCFGDDADDYVGRIYYDHGNNSMRFHANTSERMRIDSSGNVLVGKTSPTISSTGVELRPNGQLFATQSANYPLLLNRTTSDGSIAEFRKDNTTVGSIGCFGNGFYISDQGCGLSFDVEGVNNILPCNGSGSFTDNVTDLGSGSARFDDIYATNGTIQTSDRNEKQDIEALSDAEQRVAVAAKGLLRKYRWKNAVAEKGDAARIHFGIIAQDLQAAFEAEGLDAGRYGMFIRSTWWEAEVEKTREVEQEDGTTITETYTVTETYDEATEGATERTRLGVRYPELLAFIIAAL